MEITLSGRVYCTAIDHSGATVVLRQVSARAWRPANAQDTIRVLAGLRGPVLVR